jgi:hypothetical protein
VPRGPKKTSFACFPRFFKSLLCYKNFVFISKGKYKQSKDLKNLLLSVNKALLYLQVIKTSFLLAKGLCLTKRSFVLLQACFARK